jgi:hypothetical protein
MAAIRPQRFVVRCYGRKTEKGNLVGVCLDLNIAVEAQSIEELKKKMNQAIGSYIETVLDTDNRESIPALLSRRAPLKDWLTYYCIKMKHYIRQFPGNFTFKEIIPIHLTHSC